MKSTLFWQLHAYNQLLNLLQLQTATHSLSPSVKSRKYFPFLPPACVVQREGNSFTLLVCSHPGGSAGEGGSAGGGVSPAGEGSAQPGGGVSQDRTTE